MRKGHGRTRHKVLLTYRPKRKPKVKRYESDGAVLFVQRNNLEDVLDLGRFHFRDFDGFKDVFPGMNEIKAHRLVKRLLRRQFELMFQDLLDKDYFVLPRNDTAYLKIDDLNKAIPGHTYPGNIETDFVVYGGVCRLMPIMQRLVGHKHYNFQFTRRNMARIRQLRDQGRTW